MTDIEFDEKNAVGLSLKEDFKYHTAVITLSSGGGEYPTIEFECYGATANDCSCTRNSCQMKDVWNEVGWEILRASGDIELGRISARMDWADPEEPWIDVEP